VISTACYTHSFNFVFFNNTSTRTISQFLYTTANIKISHVTIFSWLHKFAPFFKQKADLFNSQLNLQSDD